ncbi:MAG: ribosome-binding factor A [Candidatus Omnitrophica bacterium CG11_big_fil_rev_8_21_14_0_20_42_13]|uniref:Ribosome-binding factor A n=1 Tax=Candidatus Ghiorseimicrobium undicola TaxID=1974746 RepID=A0A2H0LV39_9BACT|nr:MAG: ribosome-binding factor A [Candidatus Omnitrophica bacterium CG11_big_fil_rev_8_21_14_0_20_42_13]
MKRKDRVRELVREEAGKIMQEELNDPRLGFITITRVEMTDDLRYAKIYYSVLGTPKQEKDTILAMNSASGFIRKLIAERIGLRFAPDISLKLDKSAKEAMRLDEIFKDIENEHK